MSRADRVARNSTARRFLVAMRVRTNIGASIGVGYLSHGVARKFVMAITARMNPRGVCGAFIPIARRTTHCRM
jgi:hypothetical protein